MNLEQINEIITNYNILHNLAISKINVLEKLDKKYRTGNYIEKITFGDDEVFVYCDDSYRDCYDTLSFSFPITWLSKADAELEELVLIEKELNAEKERKAKEEKQLEEKKKTEQRELEEYQRLKAKFES